MRYTLEQWSWKTPLCLLGLDFVAVLLVDLLVGYLAGYLGDYLMEDLVYPQMEDRADPLVEDQVASGYQVA